VTNAGMMKAIDLVELIWVRRNKLQIGLFQCRSGARMMFVLDRPMFLTINILSAFHKNSWVDR
jgi:hypothetical protein